MPRDKKRLLSKTSAVYIAVGVALVTLMTLLGTSVFLRVVEIRVEGASKYSGEEVAEASGISAGDNLMRINKQRAVESILRALPFVKNASITRKLPDALVIEVTESSAVASIAFEGETLIIDSSCRVLIRSVIDPGGLIEIRGILIADAREGEQPRVELGEETKLQYIQDILSVLEREGLERDVSYLDVTSISNIHFGYLDIYRVILGGVRDLKLKIGKLQTSVSELALTHPNTPGDINTTDPSGNFKFKPT